MRALVRDLRIAAPALLLVASSGWWGCSSDGDGEGAATGGAAGSGGTPQGLGGSANGGSSGGAGRSANGGAGGAGGGGVVSAGGGPGTGGSSSGGAGTGGSPPGSGGAGGSAGGGGASGGSDNSGGHGSGGAPSPGRFEARALTNPPTYKGSVSGSSGCTTPSPTLGFEPVDPSGGKHPLFLYFVGTTFSASDTSARYDSLAAKTVTEAMARRGFVALSVRYDNTPSLSIDKVTCLHAPSNAESALALACKLPQVDCDLGIATWGHSQGALMAHSASQFEPRVRAVWATGYSGGSFPLPSSRLRVVNGEGDQMNGSWDTCKKAAGYATSECPNDGGSECLRADGSGFAIVRKRDCVTSTADHCWFDRRSCGDGAIILEEKWVSPSSTTRFALETNADWVAATVARR